MYKEIEKETAAEDKVDTTIPNGTERVLFIDDETMSDELAKTIREFRPDIQIILCTGYNKKLNAEKAKSIYVKTLIMKPIEYNELAKAVWRVLDKD